MNLNPQLALGLPEKSNAETTSTPSPFLQLGSLSAKIFVFGFVRFWAPQNIEKPLFIFCGTSVYL